MINTEDKLKDETPHFAKPVLCAGAVSKDGISLIHGDSLQALKSYGDNYFDVAIVDPPYGLGDRLVKGGAKGGMGTMRNLADEKVTTWDDKIPPPEYFTELQRVSKNQIIWGGNYFTDKLPISRGWIYWDKQLNKDVSFADGELAWTSFDKVLKTAKVQYSGFLGADNERIHPTQKPEKLYNWILANYATEGMKILDTHSGSGSLRISCYQNKFDFVGFEIDSHYCELSDKRFQNSISQQRLF